MINTAGESASDYIEIIGHLVALAHSRLPVCLMFAGWFGTPYFTFCRSSLQNATDCRWQQRALQLRLRCNINKMLPCIYLCERELAWLRCRLKPNFSKTKTRTRSFTAPDSQAQVDFAAFCRLPNKSAARVDELWELPSMKRRFAALICMASSSANNCRLSPISARQHDDNIRRVSIMGHLTLPSLPMRRHQLFWCDFYI